MQQIESRQSVQLRVNVPPELRRRLKIHAAQEGVTVREFVGRAIERALAEAEKNAKSRDRTLGRLTEK